MLQFIPFNCFFFLFRVKSASISALLLGGKRKQKWNKNLFEQICHLPFQCKPHSCFHGLVLGTVEEVFSCDLGITEDRSLYHTLCAHAVAGRGALDLSTATTRHQMQSNVWPPFHSTKSPHLLSQGREVNITTEIKYTQGERKREVEDRASKTETAKVQRRRKIVKKRKITTQIQVWKEGKKMHYSHCYAGITDIAPCLLIDTGKTSSPATVAQRKVSHCWTEHPHWKSKVSSAWHRSLKAPAGTVELNIFIATDFHKRLWDTFRLGESREHLKPIGLW